MQNKTRQILQKLVEKADEISHSRLVQTLQRDGLELNIHYEGESGVTRITYTDVDREALQAFILTFRMFYDGTDLIALRKLPQLVNADLSKNWRRGIQQVNGWLMKYLADVPSPTFVIDSNPLTKKDILTTFLYGDFSHISEMFTFEEWKKIELMFPLLKQELYTILMDIVTAIEFIAKVARAELKNP